MRNAHGWKPGTVFEVRETPEGVLLSPIQAGPVFAPTTVDQVFGMGRRPERKALSLAAMDAAVSQEAARRK